MMDIIVREIKYELLNDIARFFSIDNQLTFVSYLDKEQIDKEYNIKPYILKEYIADIDAVLDECETYANDYYMSPIHKVIKWDDFYFFWQVMRTIEHKRKIGKQVSDLEYVYEILKGYKNVEYTTTDKLDGFTISCDVIYIKLDDIVINLYQDEESDDFVLSVENKCYNYFTHWHPQNCEEIIYEIKNMFEKGISKIFEKIDDKEKFVDILFPVFVDDINQLIFYQKDSKYIIINIKNEISR
jgi:hypothetical protein